MKYIQILDTVCQKDLGTCCNDPGIVGIIDVVRNMFTVFQILVPIVLIVSLIYHFMRLAKNPDLKNGNKMITNRIAATFMVFLIPMFVDFSMNLLGEGTTVKIGACWKTAMTIKEQQTGTAQYIEIEDEKRTMLIDSQTSNNSSTNEDGLTFLESDVKPYDEEEARKKEQQAKENQNSSQQKEEAKVQTQVSGNTTTFDSSNYSSDNSSNVTAGDGSVKGQDIVNYALKFVGQRYVYGGQWNGEEPYTPTDCSGFVQGVFKHHGISLQRSTSAIWADKSKYTLVSANDIRAGDLVMYDGHVGILTGNGNQLVHAATTKKGIVLANDYRFSPVKGIMRVKGVN